MLKAEKMKKAHNHAIKKFEETQKMLRSLLVAVTVTESGSFPAGGVRAEDDDGWTTVKYDERQMNTRYAVCE